MNKTAIIIGSGFGGLSLAIRLQARGINTKIYEKNSMPGGHASQLKKKGYIFDLGPSLITETGIIQELFATAGKKMEEYLKVVKLDPFYRIYFHDKSYIDYTDDEQSMKSQLAKFNPQDAKNYDRFMNYSKKLYQAVIVDKLGAKPFITIKDMFSFIPKALKLNALFPAYWFATRFFQDFRARFVFSFHTLFIGGNPFRAPSLFLMLPYLEKTGGVWFSYGGMYSLVEAMVKLYTEMGGEIITNSEVQEILIENKTAVGIRVNDKIERADIIVSNAHSAHTYMDLIPEQKRKKWSNAKIKKQNYSMSSVVIYLGVKKQYSELKHHTLILSPRYQGLINDIFNKRIVPDDFSMYLHAPTRTDSTMAPKGCDSLYVLVPVANLKGDYDWNNKTNEFVEKVLNFLEKDFGLVDLKKNIEVQEVFSPLDFEKVRNNYLGAAWSLEPSLFQVANFRAHNVSEEFKNLYLVGVSGHPGGGVPGVMLSAETTEKLIIKEHINNKNA